MVNISMESILYTNSIIYIKLKIKDVIKRKKNGILANFTNKDMSKMIIMAI